MKEEWIYQQSFLVSNWPRLSFQKQKATSEKRRELYDSIAGQEISVTPEVGDRITLKLRNCAYNADDGTTYIGVGIYDPNKSTELFRLEADFRFHYRKRFFQSALEQSDPLIRKLRFVELGPEDFKIELQVNSDDLATVQLAFERIEVTMTQIHTEYHQYLRSLYEEWKDEFEVSKSFEDGEMQYEANSDIDTEKLVPQPNESDFSFRTVDEMISPHDRITFAYYAHAYIEHSVLADAGGEEYFVFV